MDNPSRGNRQADTDPPEPAASDAFAVLSCLTPHWAVSSRVTAFSTTRSGGVSEAPYDALNFGLHVGDDENAVVENRRRLQDCFALPGPPHWLQQTHSVDVADLTVAAHESGVCADGAWTNEPDTVLAVLTADCLPVVISDTQGTELAVVHAGWRGLAAGILHNALARFSIDLQLHAWLGPAIGPQAFEVGAEVRQAFIERNPAHAASFIPTATAGAQQPSEVKYRADLYALATRELQQSRAIQVSGGDYCTLTQAEYFHSHRRDGARSGRMATIAWMDGVHTQAGPA